MRHIAIALGSVACLLAAVPAAHAQQFVVQEPSLETFGVATTVSVPDRGRTSLGGVRRSSASQSTYGPFRSGYNLGLSSQGSGLSLQARIHDASEMDRLVLDAARKEGRTNGGPRLSPAAEHAFETLLTRRTQRDPVGVAPGVARMTAAPDEEVKGIRRFEGPVPETLLKRAREAEAGGKRELALAYLRAARDQGSAPARKEIDRLNRQSR